MKLWKTASWIAAGIAVVSVIAIVLFYSIPVNPCTLFPFQNADALLASTTAQELYDSSELVVIGRVTDSTSKCEGSQIWTHAQVQVEESLKNPQGINFFTAKSIGGTIGNYGYWLEDSPIFKRGDRVLLYLYKDKPGDKIYRISPYSGPLVDKNGFPDETVTGKDILKTFSLGVVTTDNLPHSGCFWL